MYQSLSDYRLKKCSTLSRRLAEFKDALGTSEFETATNNLHVSFLQLINSFEMRPRPALEKEELQSYGMIKRFKVHGIELLVHDGLVIDVDNSSMELACIFVNKRLKEAENLANLFWDHRNRPCDACGMYFMNPGFSIPLIRMELNGFTLAFHEVCSEMEIW